MHVLDHFQSPNYCSKQPRNFILYQLLMLHTATACIPFRFLFSFFSSSSSLFWFFFREVSHYLIQRSITRALHVSSTTIFWSLVCVVFIYFLSLFCDTGLIHQSHFFVVYLDRLSFPRNFITISVHLKITLAIDRYISTRINQLIEVKMKKQ